MGKPRSLGARLRKTPIAIVGMGGFFPEARNISEFWQNLLSGKDCTRSVPVTPSYWDERFFKGEATATDPFRVPHSKAGYLPSVRFDPLRYGMTPLGLSAISCFQLYALLAAEQALGDAGLLQAPLALRRRTAVILAAGGMGTLGYEASKHLEAKTWRQVMTSSGISADQQEVMLDKLRDLYPEWQEQTFPGLLPNICAGRIANRFDLGGANYTVDAACAASLAAMRAAVLELLDGEADAVLTGAVNADNSIFQFICYDQVQALSPSGQCRPLAKDADGMILGDAVAMLVLRRLEDAERDGNQIYALISGLGAASDGRGSSIYAPNAAGQLRAMQAAYVGTGIKPADISAIELHGTGTPLGDPVEIAALKKLYARHKSARGSIALGAIKAQVGHTRLAAGTVSTIKMALALHQRVLPATIHTGDTNPLLGLDTSPLELNKTSKPWCVEAGKVRHASINAFGFGGTNFHLVLSEYQGPQRANGPGAQIQIAVMATTATQAAAAALSNNDFASVAALMATPLSAERCAFHYREPIELLAKLSAPLPVAMTRPNLVLLRFSAVIMQEASPYWQMLAPDLVGADSGAETACKIWQKAGLVCNEDRAGNAGWLARFLAKTTADSSVLILDHGGNASDFEAELEQLPNGAQIVWRPIAADNDDIVIALTELCALGLTEPGYFAAQWPRYPVLATTQQSAVTITIDGGINQAPNIIAARQQLLDLAPTPLYQPQVDHGASERLATRLLDIEQQYLTLQQHLTTAGLSAQQELLTMQHSDFLAAQARLWTAPTAPIEVQKRTLSSFNAAELDALILKIVTEKTGLPPDLVHWDLDIEADLGIDSIKRLEILVELSESLPQLPQSALIETEIAQLRTLREVRQLLEAKAEAFSILPSTPPMKALAAPENSAPLSIFVPTFSPSPAPLPDDADAVATTGSWLLLSLDACSLVAMATNVFAANLATAPCVLNSDALTLDIEEWQQLRLQGIILLLPAPLRSDDLAISTNAAIDRLHALHTLMQGLFDVLPVAAHFWAISVGDGCGGLRASTDIWSLGLGAYLRSWAKERPELKWQHLDLAQDLSPAIQTQILRTEWQHLHSAPDVWGRLDLSSRMQWQWEARPLPTNADKPVAGPVLITGGGRGITALCLQALAKAAPDTCFIIWGRTSLENLPDAESIMSQRQAEIRTLLETLAALQVRVHYRQVDLSDAAATEAALQAEVEQHGPIQTLIHAAGITADRIALRKPHEELERVIATKLRGLAILLKHELMPALQRVVLFSSVVGLSGNSGQTDYAFANGVLNQLALHLRHARPEILTQAVAWGPWDGGMVGPRLRQIFQRRGIALISPEAGAAAFMAIMQAQEPLPPLFLLAPDTKAFMPMVSEMGA